MSALTVYINNAVKMMSLYVQNGELINDHYNVEQLKAATRLLAAIQSLLNVNIVEHAKYIENWNYRKNGFLLPVLWLFDLPLLLLPHTLDNGLRLLATNTAKPSFISKRVLKQFLASNWLSEVEKAHNNSNHGILPLPALYWACFVKYNYLKYEN